MRSIEIRTIARPVGSAGNNPRSWPKVLVLRLEHLAPAVKPNDARRPLKRAHHEDDAPVFSQVRYSFNPAAYVVQIRQRVRSEYSQCIQALRREIDMPTRVQRSGGNEEYVLRPNEFLKSGVNLFVDFSHSAIKFQPRATRDPRRDFVLRLLSNASRCLWTNF